MAGESAGVNAGKFITGIGNSVINAGKEAAYGVYDGAQVAYGGAKIAAKEGLSAIGADEAAKKIILDDIEPLSSLGKVAAQGGYKGLGKAVKDIPANLGKAASEAYAEKNYEKMGEVFGDTSLLLGGAKGGLAGVAKGAGKAATVAGKAATAAKTAAKAVTKTAKKAASKAKAKAAKLKAKKAKNPALSNKGCAGCNKNNNVAARSNKNKSKSKPKGVIFKGKVYRYTKPEFESTTWEAHVYNVNSNHRYTPPGQGGVYAGAEPETALAEISHYGSTEGLKTVSKEIQVDNMLDLNIPLTQKELRISLKDITSNSYETTHKIGVFAKENGYNGIIAPSARNPGGNNIIVFKGM
ncbi:MAG: RES family NAD+ phosphorylase [Methylococcaceae bacterium]|jgi:RES domain-containing protein